MENKKTSEKWGILKMIGLLILFVLMFLLSPLILLVAPIAAIYYFVFKKNI